VQIVVRPWNSSCRP